MLSCTNETSKTVVSKMFFALCASTCGLDVRVEKSVLCWVTKESEVGALVSTSIGAYENTHTHTHAGTRSHMGLKTVSFPHQS